MRDAAIIALKDTAIIVLLILGLFLLSSSLMGFAVYLVWNDLLPAFGQDVSLSYGQSFKAGLVLCFLGWLWNMNKAGRKA